MSGRAQGDVTVSHFPGILGALGWGWLHPRFLVLEHSVVLVFSSEEDWAEHREPLDDIALSADAVVELSMEGGETLVKLRCPGHSPLSFNGSAEDTEGLSSEAWCTAITHVISNLRRELPSPAIQTSGGLSSWRFWNPFGGSSGGWSGAGAKEDHNVETAVDEEDNSLHESEGLEDDSGEDDDEEEEKRGVEDAKSGGENGREEGGITLGRRSSSGPRRGKGGRFRRWPLRRGSSIRHIADYDDSNNAASSQSVTPRGVGDGIRTGASSAMRESGGGAGDRSGVGLWRKARAAVRTRSCLECDCKWCKEGGTGSHRGPPRLAKSMSSKHKCCWIKKWAAVDTSPAVDRWEYLVGKWIPLQLARSGDVLGVKSFLEKFPAFTDKENLLRAAVRYKQYSLVQYFLDEQHMDVNLENAAGMPLVWFSVVFMQKGDSGVMLRYLLQKGADIKTRSPEGQTVLFLVVSSRGREAIPMLKYLVEECGLDLKVRDNFGSQALHWAVLHGHMDTVQWISRYTRCISARADWAGAFQKMEKIRLVRPEHMGAVRSWRMRGLQKSARSLTPLGVAVLHNHENIAKWLMGYGFEDSDCIAFKRANLFIEENRDLALVSKTWPELLPEILQGFEQKARKANSSWDTEDKIAVTPTGWSERTYDVKLLYGSPDVPPSRSPLNILLSTDHPSLFEVKVVQMVVALKWSVFGHWYYVWELARYTVLALTFIMGFIIWGDSSNWVGDIDAGEDRLHVVGGTLSRTLCWACTLYNLFVEEGRELKASKSVKKYILGGWNLQSVVAYVLVLSLIPVFKPWKRHVEWEIEELEYTSAGIIRRVMTAPAALFLFTRFMEHLAVWRSTGIFIAVIRMVILDTASWSVLFILFEVAFALAFYALLQGNDGFHTIWESMVSVFVMSMGEIDIPFSEDEYLHIVAVLIFVTFMLLVAIVYLNLLVAMMTSGYTKVVNGATAQAMMNRAAALVKWEGIMSQSIRKKAYERVAPARGKRSHITLKGWFGHGSTEVFCSEEGARAVEPEQSSNTKTIDPHMAIMKELAEMRTMVERLSKRHLPRAPPADQDDSFNSSSDNQDASFRKRQAGMLDEHGKGLSSLRLVGKERRGSMGSVTADDLKAWRERAREIQEEAKSRQGVVRAQAIIRGYLSRSKSGARFLPDNKDPEEDG